MPLQELVVQLKARKNLQLALKNAFVCLFLALGKETMVLKTFKMTL